MFTRGIELLSEVEESRERQRLELALQTPLAGSLAIAKGWASGDVAAAATRARELGRDLGGGPEHDQALLWLSMHHWLRAHLDLNIQLLEERLRLEARGDDAYVRLSVMVGIGVSRYFRGELDLARRQLDDAISYFRATGDAIAPLTNQPDPRTQALIYHGLVLLILGFPEAARARSDEAVELARDIEHPLSIAACRALAGQIHLMLGEYERAREETAAAMALSRELGFPFYLGFARFIFGSAHLDVPQPETGWVHCQEAQALLRPMRIKVGAPHACALLAELCCAAGRLEDATRALETGFAAAESTGQHYWRAELHRLRAEVFLRRDEADPGHPGEEPAEAKLELKRALEVARDQGARWFELRAGIRLAELHGAREAWAEAEALLAPIQEGFTEGLETLDFQTAGTQLEQARSRLLSQPPALEIRR